MQEPFRNKKNRGYRLRPASGRDRLDSRVRLLCSRLGILAVVVAAAIVIRSLYNIQIIHGAEYRQYAAQQQLLDTTIKATRARSTMLRHHPCLHQRGVDHLGRPQLQQHPLYQQDQR